MNTDTGLMKNARIFVADKAVPIAQSLYNLIYGTSMFFSEDCPKYLPRSVYSECFYSE
jgi:hypothetical protein